MPAPFYAAPRPASSPDRTCSWTVAPTPARSRMPDPWRRIHESAVRCRFVVPRRCSRRAGVSEPRGQGDRAVAAGPGDRHRRAHGRAEAAGAARAALRDREPARRRRLARPAIVATSAADGYTLLAASRGPISIMPNLQKMPYEPQKDFVLISLIARQSLRAGGASVVPGEQREGVRRAAQGESGQVHLRLIRHRRHGAPGDRAFQLDGAGEGAPYPLQGQRAGDHRRHQRTGRLHGGDGRPRPATSVRAPEGASASPPRARGRAAGRAAARRGGRLARVRHRGAGSAMPRRRERRAKPSRASRPRSRRRCRRPTCKEQLLNAGLDPVVEHARRDACVHAPRAGALRPPSSGTPTSKSSHDPPRHRRRIAALSRLPRSRRAIPTGQ